MNRLILTLSLTIAPALAATIQPAQPLTFTAVAMPIAAEPGYYLGGESAYLIVAPNPNSPIPGIAAELDYDYSYNAPDASCGGCEWSFELYAIPWADNNYDVFSVDGNPAPQNFEAFGSQTGIAYLSAGDYKISLVAMADYGPGVTPVGSLPSISLSFYTVFGSISDQPSAPVDAPEPSTWIGIALVMLCLMAWGARGRVRQEPSYSGLTSTPAPHSSQTNAITREKSPIS